MITSSSDPGSATFAVSLGSGVAAAAGRVQFQASTGTTGLLAGVDILALHISDASVFVGVGGGLNGAHDAVTVGTVGIDATGVSLDYVTAVASGNTYTGLHLHAATLTLHGFDAALQLYITNLDVNANDPVCPELVRFELHAAQCQFTCLVH